MVAHAVLDEDADPIEARPARPPPDDPMVDVDVQREQGEDVQLALWPDEDEDHRDWR